MESMWRDLPLDILEKVITFLPLVAVCRFRTVSKIWNRFISDPDFAARHARASSPGECVLITMRYGILTSEKNPSNVIEDWDVLDVANKRFFTLSGDFLRQYVQRKRIAFVPSSKTSQRYFLAADGGLFCMSYFSSVSKSGLLVCNPILKTVKRLPPLPELSEGRFHHDSGVGFQRVVMSTDRLSMQYEVFVIYPTTLHIYESKTARWRTASTRPPPLTHISWKWYPASFFVKNENHKLFVHGDCVEKGILSYDMETGVASELGIDFPCFSQHKPQLVLSKDRLFCVTVVYGWSQRTSSIDIFEVIIARKECVWLTRMPSELMDWVEGDDLELEYGHIPDDTIVASGSADSILIFSDVGRCVGYSLSGKAWHQYPDNYNFRKDPCYDPYSEEYQELCESNYCLSLCPV